MGYPGPLRVPAVKVRILEFDAKFEKAPGGQVHSPQGWQQVMRALARSGPAAN
jgi:hypothetical protein